MITCKDIHLWFHIRFDHAGARPRTNITPTTDPKDSIDVADGLVAAHQRLSNVYYVTQEYVKCADRKMIRHIVKCAILAKYGDIALG